MFTTTGLKLTEQHLLYKILKGLGDYYWTPNFNGVNSYGQLLSAWQPSGAEWEIDAEVYFGDTTDNQTIVGNDAENSINVDLTITTLRFFVYAGTTLQTILTIPRPTIPRFCTVNASYDGTTATLTLGSTSVTTNTWVLTGNETVKYVAARTDISRFLDGQIQSIKLTDLNDSSNSIEIDTVIRAAEMPSDTYLYNSLDTTDYPELVTNGDFSDGLTEWNNFNSTLSVIDDKLYVYTTSGVRGAYQNIATVIGESYVCKAKSTSVVSGTVVRVTNGDVPSFGFGDYLVVDNSVYFVFVAQGPITNIYLRNGSEGTSIWDSVSVKQTNIIGELYNLGTDQPYVPQLKGGEIDRSQVDGKSEQYCSPFTSGDYIDGVNLALGRVTSVLSTSSDNKSGSFIGAATVGDMLIAKTGAVVKSYAVADADSTYRYTVLLGTDEQIQQGFQYPNVFRVLEPDTDVNSEYYYYNNGGSYPWKSLYPSLLLTPSSQMGDYF